MFALTEPASVFARQPGYAETRAAPIHNRSPQTSIYTNFYKLISGIKSLTGEMNVYLAMFILISVAGRRPALPLALYPFVWYSIPILGTIYNLQTHRQRALQILMRQHQFFQKPILLQ